MKERVLCAAIYVDTGKAEPPRRSYTYPPTGLVFAGWRHSDCFTTLNAWAEKLTPGEVQACNERDMRAVGHDLDTLPSKSQAAMQESIRGFNQGFITSTGRFVSREEAMQVAKAADQVKPDRGESLRSEDLY